MKFLFLFPSEKILDPRVLLEENNPCDIDKRENTLNIESFWRNSSRRFRFRFYRLPSAANNRSADRSRLSHLFREEITANDDCAAGRSDEK